MLEEWVCQGRLDSPDREVQPDHLEEQFSEDFQDLEETQVCEYFVPFVML